MLYANCTSTNGWLSTYKTISQVYRCASYKHDNANAVKELIIIPHEKRKTKMSQVSSLSCPIFSCFSIRRATLTRTLHPLLQCSLQYKHVTFLLYFTHGYIDETLLAFLLKWSNWVANGKFKWQKTQGARYLMHTRAPSLRY